MLFRSADFSVGNIDGNFFVMQAARRGRGGTGAAFGRPLPYASAGFLNDLQVRANLNGRNPSQFADFTVQAWGRVNVGGSGSKLAMALAYVWNNRTRRWLYLTTGFLDSTFPTQGSTPALVGSVMSRGVDPLAVLVPEGGDTVAYIRLVTYGLGVMGSYQTWWDQILIDTNPLQNPN